jgi:hypothetical protein
MKKRSQAKLAAPAKSAPAPVAHPNLDPMEVDLRELTPEEGRWVRAELLARIQQKLADMSACSLRSIVWYIEIEEEDQGCMTSAEDFIGKLALAHHYRGLTPDHAANYLEDFRADFDSAIDTTKYLTAKYPALVNSTRVS